MEPTGAPRYEIRDLGLYVNGERQAVSRATVLLALATDRSRGNALPGAAAGPAEIPGELGRRILRMEARRARYELARALMTPFPVPVAPCGTSPK